MAKNKHKVKLQTRDWAIIVLFLAIIGTNWVWYQLRQETLRILEVQGWNDYKLFVQNSQLHLCFEHNTRPCDLVPEGMSAEGQ